MPRRLVLSNDLPKDWQWVSLEELVSQVAFPVTLQQDQEYDLLGVKWYGAGVFHRETLAGRDIEAKTLFRAVPGAFIYNRLFAWKQSFAVVTEEHGNALVSGEFPQFVVDAERLSVEYLRLFFLTPEVTALVNGASAGSAAVSRNRFKESEFLRFEVPLPVLDVQRAIVERAQQAKADYENGLRALEAKQATRFEPLRELLGNMIIERRQPRLYGLEWHQLGRWGVEAAWADAHRLQKTHFPTFSIKELCSIGSGGTPSRSVSHYYGGDIPWVKTTEVRGNVINETLEAITEEGLKSSSAKIYPKGSLIIAMYGQGATRGRTAKLGMDAATNQACAVLHNFKPEIEPDFLWSYLQSEYGAMRSMASGNNQPNLNAEMIATYPVPLPPLETQRAIVARLQEGQQEIENTRQSLESDFKAAQIEVEHRILGRAS